MLNRRHFLISSATVATGFLGLRQYLSTASAAASEKNVAPYGPLQPDSEGILDLPRGFSYRIISRRGERMDDGLYNPGLPDGMATFPGPQGTTILIRNHELNPHQGRPFGKNNERLKHVDPQKLYDLGHKKTPGTGGTSTVVFDTKRQKIVRQFMSLAGTYRNCAGGPTPWNSWVSCEETVHRVGPDDDNKYVAEKDHGYNFEVPATPQISLADPVPLKEMGRFNHEAIAVDAHSGIVYQTEDRHDGLIYRYIPHRPGKLAAGGRLQALKIIDQPSADTRNWNDKHGIEVGQSLPVEWIDLHDIQSPQDDLRFRSFEDGAARFARGEGMWSGDKDIFFACTNGGVKKKGQIWKYTPGPEEGTPQESQNPGRLELFVEPNDSALIENADNLTLAPWGDLMVCEDRSGDVVRIVGVTPQGRFYTFAHHHLNTEFAGATFSPDGSTLFVNIQGKGLTLAITGPWKASATS